MSGRPVIFLDRDGTLNEQVGFINHVDRFQLFPWSAEAVRLVNRSGFGAIVVTNQSGVARGITPETLVEAVHSRLRELLGRAGAHVDAIYCCPHLTEDACECRKPKPGMLLRAQKELGIDLSRSWVVGDSYPDLEMAWNAGARGALVLTGYGSGYYENGREIWARQPDILAPNVYSAVMEIVWGGQK